METLYDSTVESRVYNEKLESILVEKTGDYAGQAKEAVPAAENYFFLPVIFSSAESLLNPEESIENVYMAQGILQDASQIITEAKQIQEKLVWKDVSEKEKEQLKREFMLLCEDGNGDERLNKEILRLFDESAWEVPQ
jgi:hypothetical protein